MKIIIEQKPEVVFMAPLCSPWSQWSNMKEPYTREADRQAVMSMVRFCVQVAMHQLKRNKWFIIENPQESAIWYTHCFKDLTRQEKVTWNCLHFCAFGMKDPASNDYYFKPTCLVHNFGDHLAPLFKTCPNLSSIQKKHKHEAVQGWCPGHGQRSKLSQVYPYKFCSALAELLGKFLDKRIKNQNTYLIEDILDAALTTEEILEFACAQHDLVSQEWTLDTALATDTVDPVAVTDYQVRELQVAVNSLPRHGELLLHVEPRTNLAQKLITLSQFVRQQILPTHLFWKCAILRGTFGTRQKVLSSGVEGYLFMWKKTEPSKGIYVMNVQRQMEYLTGLDPGAWSMVHFYKEGDGRSSTLTPSNKTTKQAPIPKPPGLPPPPGGPGRETIREALAKPDEPMPPPDQDMPQAVAPLSPPPAPPPDPPPAKRPKAQPQPLVQVANTPQVPPAPQIPPPVQPLSVPMDITGELSHDLGGEQTQHFQPLKPSQPKPAPPTMPKQPQPAAIPKPKPIPPQLQPQPTIQHQTPASSSNQQAPPAKAAPAAKMRLNKKQKRPEHYNIGTSDEDNPEEEADGTPGGLPIADESETETIEYQDESTTS